jgi:hypothetical protein
MTMMPESFSLSPSRCKVITDPKLREEIQSHTLSDDATARILRSLGRFGVDASIERYELTPKTHHRVALPSTVAWTVRAVRAASSLRQPEVVQGA